MRRPTMVHLLLLLATVTAVWMVVAAGTAVYPTVADAPTIRPTGQRVVKTTNPLLILLVQIGVILILARALGRLCQWFRQPMVIGEMLAGILLGPSLLGWLAPDLSAALFPEDSIQYLRVLSQVGIIIFLFLIGLELDPSLLRSQGQAAVLISNASIAVPFVLGTCLTLYLYPRHFQDVPGADFAAIALFMGAAMSVTALPVLARLLTERNLHRSTYGTIAITSAAIGDATAWCMVAMVVGIARAQGATQGLYIAAMAVAYVLVMFFLVRPLLRKLGRLHEVQGGLSQSAVAIVFILVLASAWVTEQIGIHALFGAFMMGAIMPKGTAFVRSLLDKLEDFTVVFLLPIFFAYAGLQTQIGLLGDQPSLWLDTLLIVGIACIGKFGGTTVAGLASGLQRRDSMILGVLMNTRGLMELVILQIGLQEGILTPPVFAMMVIMALVTTAMTSPLLSLLTRRAPPVAPAPAVAQTTVLVPVAAAESGPALARLAATILGTASTTTPSPDTARGATEPPPRGRLLALHLVQPEDDRFGAGLAEMDAARDQALRPLTTAAQRMGLAVEPISFATTDVAADIAEVANARRPWLVLMGIHRPVFGTEILGGVVHQVFELAKPHVGVLVDRGLETPRRVLVPYLGGPHDRVALAIAERMCRLSGSAVTILHIVPPNRTDAAARLDAAGTVDRTFTDPRSRASVQLRIVPHEVPLDLMLQSAPEFDLVIVGVDETWGLESHWFGFRPQRLADESETSVLIVRRGTAETDPQA